MDFGKKHDLKEGCFSSYGYSEKLNNVILREYKTDFQIIL